MQGQYRKQVIDLKGRYDADGKPIQPGEGHDSAAQNRPSTTLYDILLSDLRFRQQNTTKNLIPPIRIYLSKLGGSPIPEQQAGARDVFFKLVNDTVNGRITIAALDPDVPGATVVPTSIMFGPGDVSALMPFMLLTLPQRTLPLPVYQAALRIRPAGSPEDPWNSYKNKDIQIIIERKDAWAGSATVETRSEEPYVLAGATYYQKFRISCSPEATIDQVRVAIDSIQWDSRQVFSADIIGDVKAGALVSDVISSGELVLRYIPMTPTVSLTDINANLFERFFNATSAPAVPYSVFKYEVASTKAYFKNPGVYGFVFKRTGSGLYETMEPDGRMVMDFGLGSKAFVQIPNRQNAVGFSDSPVGVVPSWYNVDNPLFNPIAGSELTSVELDTELIFIPFVEVTDRTIRFATGFAIDLDYFRSVLAFETTGSIHNMTDPTAGNKVVESQVVFDSDLTTNPVYHARLEALYKRVWLQNTDPLPATSSALDIWQKFKFGAVKYTRDVVIIDTAIVDLVANTPEMRDCRIYNSLSAAMADTGNPSALNREAGRPLATGDRILVITGGTPALTRTPLVIPNGLPNGLEFIAVSIDSLDTRTAADPDFTLEGSALAAVEFIIPNTFDSGTFPFGFPRIYAPNVYATHIYIQDGTPNLTFANITTPELVIIGEYLSVTPTQFPVMSVSHGNSLKKLSFRNISIDHLDLGNFSYDITDANRIDIDFVQILDTYGVVVNRLRVGTGRIRVIHADVAQLTIHGGESRLEPYGHQADYKPAVDTRAQHIRLRPTTWRIFPNAETMNYIVNFDATASGIIDNLDLTLDIAFRSLWGVVDPDIRDLNTIQDLIFVGTEIRDSRITINVSGYSHATRADFITSPDSDLPSTFMFLNCGMDYSTSTPRRPDIGGLFINTKLDVCLTDYLNSSNIAPLFTQDLFYDAPDVFYFGDRNFTDPAVRFSEDIDFSVTAASMKNSSTPHIRGLVGWAPHHKNTNLFPVVTGSYMEYWKRAVRFVSCLKSSRVKIPLLWVQSYYPDADQGFTPVGGQYRRSIIFSDMMDSDIQVDTLTTMRDPAHPTYAYFQFLHLISSHFEPVVLFNGGARLRIRTWATQHPIVYVGGLGPGAEVDIAYNMYDYGNAHSFAAVSCTGANIKLRSANALSIIPLTTSSGPTDTVREKFVDKMNDYFRGEFGGFTGFLPQSCTLETEELRLRLYTLFLGYAYDWTGVAGVDFLLWKPVVECEFSHLMVEDIVVYGPAYYNRGSGFWMQFGEGTIARPQVITTPTNPNNQKYPVNSIVGVFDENLQKQRWFRAKRNQVNAAFTQSGGGVYPTTRTDWVEIASGFTYPRYGNVGSEVVFGPAAGSRYEVGDRRAESTMTSFPVMTVRDLICPSGPIYNAGHTYCKNYVVVEGTDAYISLQDGNIGHTPSTSPLFWFLLSHTLEGFIDSTIYDWRDDDLMLGTNRFRMDYISPSPRDNNLTGRGYLDMVKTTP